MLNLARPRPEDHPPYYKAYVLATTGADLAEAFRLTSEEEARTMALVPEHKWEHRYAPGKWTTKEVFQHIIDTERVFAYRAFCIARNEKANLPAMDEDAYQAEARTARRSVDELMRELQAVRQATIALFEGLDAEGASRAGTANGKHITVGALAWIIPGHSLHHLRIIRERYLG
jgi:hypothetical protein